MDNFVITDEWIVANVEKIKNKIDRVLRQHARRKGYEMNDDVDTSVLSDVVQAAIIKAMKYKSSYDPNKSFTNWFISIAVNVFKDQCSDDEKDNCGPFNVSLDEYSNYSSLQKNSSRYMDESSLVNDVHNKITLSKALEILDNMPETLRVPLYRREFLQEDYEDIAKDLGISVQAVRVRICRAKNMARQKAAVFIA